MADANLLVALGLTVPVTVIIIGVGTGIGASGAIYVGTLLGQGREDELNGFIFFSNLGLVLVFAPVSWVLSFFMENIVGTFMESSLLSTNVSSYLGIWILGVPFLFSSMFSSQVLRALGKVKIYGCVLLVAACLTTILEPVLILGIGFSPALELRGIGVAFIFSSCVSSVFAITQLSDLWADSRFSITHMNAMKHHLAKLFNASKNLILLSAQAPMVKLILVAIVANDDPIAGAVLGLCFRFEAVFLIPVNAIGGSLFTLLPISIGKGQFRVADRIVTRACWGAFVVQMLIACMIMIVMMQLVSLISISHLQAEYFKSYFISVSWSYGLLSISILLSHGLNMYGRQGLSLGISLVRNFVFLIPIFFFAQCYLGFEAALYVVSYINIAFGLVYLVVFYFQQREFESKYLAIKA